MKLKFYLILAVAALFLIAACSSEDATPSSVALPSGGNAAGTWTTACFGVDATGAGGGLTSDQTTITLSGGSGTFSTDYYFSVADCTGDADTTEAGTWTFTFNGTKTTTASQVLASLVDGVDTAHTMTTNTASGAAGTDYGFSDWAAGTSHDILGKNADGSTFTNFTFKDLMYLFEDAILFFGDDAGTFDASGYPDDLDARSFGKL